MVYLVSFVVGWYILSLDVVWYDLLNFDRMDSPLETWIYIAPPLLPFVAYAILFRRGYVI